MRRSRWAAPWIEPSRHISTTAPTKCLALVSVWQSDNIMEPYRQKRSSGSAGLNSGTEPPTDKRPRLSPDDDAMVIDTDSPLPNFQFHGSDPTLNHQRSPYEAPPDPSNLHDARSGLSLYQLNLASPTSGNSSPGWPSGDASQCSDVDSADSPSGGSCGSQAEKAKDSQMTNGKPLLTLCHPYLTDLICTRE